MNLLLQFPSLREQLAIEGFLELHWRRVVFDAFKNLGLKIDGTLINPNTPALSNLVSCHLPCTIILSMAR
jgi:hypothetical protein